MLRIIYHGSENIIEKPVYGIGNKFNDYGLGFYCCSSLPLAREWAARKSGYGFVNKYEIRDDRLRILDLTKGENSNVLIWIALLLNNRSISKNIIKEYPLEFKFLFDNYLIDTSKYDIVIGYRADDAYFKFPISFIQGDITLETLEKIYKTGNLGKQYVLISQRAFNLLKFQDYIPVTSESKIDYYRRKNEADSLFDELVKQDKYKKGTRLVDLVINNEK